MKDNNPPPLTPTEIVANTSAPAPDKPRCQCEKSQGWAVYCGRNSGWIICADCSLRVRQMTKEDWDNF